MTQKIKRHAVSTVDNPFCPITQYPLWARFDEDHGYHTMNYLMRVARVSPEMEDFEYENEIARAVDGITRLNPLGIYKKVVVEVEEEIDD